MIGTYQDISLRPGSWSGGVLAYNIGIYSPLVANVPTVTSALTPAVLKACIPNQATDGVLGISYGIPVALAKAALPGLSIKINNLDTLSIEGMLALLVANVQNIYTNLRAAGIAGFTTY